MSARRRIGFVTGLTAEAGWLRGQGFLVAAGGGEPAGAARAAAALLSQGAKALISFGLAGGLDTALAAGALIVPKAIVADEQTYQCDDDLLRWLGNATVEAIFAGRAIAATIAEKSALRSRTGAAAIDLESGAVAAAAGSAGVPMAVLRAIADPASRPLPPAALLALDPKGRISVARISAELVRRPRQLPALLALAGDASRARTTLRRHLRGLTRSAFYER